MNQRQRVVAEAEAWLRTPYHHMGRIKGGGTDCLMLLAEVYEAAGVIPHVDVPFYPPDWNLHRDAERYVHGVMRYAARLADRLRAVMWQSSSLVVASRTARLSSPGRD
jgi:hypothetical protein